MTAERENRKSAAARIAAAGIAAAGLAVAGMPAGILSTGAVHAEAAEKDTGAAAAGTAAGQASGEKVTLRIANWEEYIDEGGWDEEEAIDLDDREGTVILGENSMIEDFEAWYLENYGVEVDVDEAVKDFLNVCMRISTTSSHSAIRLILSVRRNICS